MSEREKLVEDAKDAILAEVPIGYGMTKDEARNYVRAVFRVAERTHALVPVEASEGEIAKAAQEYMDATKAMYAIKPIPKGQFTMKIPSDEQVRQMKAEAALVAALAYHRKTDGEPE